MPDKSCICLEPFVRSRATCITVKLIINATIIALIKFNSVTGIVSRQARTSRKFVEFERKLDDNGALNVTICGVFKLKLLANANMRLSISLMILALE